MLPETRYASSGEVKIAYQVIGEGPIDLVFVPGFISHLDLQWGLPEFARFLERLASFSRVILFDKRGTGLSDPVAAPAPLEQRMDDVRAVMDAAGSERAALLGLSEGGPMSILFAATYPERTAALILCGTFATGALDPRENPAGARWAEALGRVRSLLDHWGEGHTLGVFAPSVASEENRRLRAMLERSAATPAMARMLIDMVIDTDVRDVLPAIRVPTLVLHRQDELIPVEGARYMAERIAGAKLVVLPGVDHVPFYGDAEGYVEEVEEFLTGARHLPEPDRVLTTVMFTDIVGSTERAACVGDSEWRRLVERHDGLVRNRLERHQGREVKTLGDGFLASFDGPARAIRCAGEVIRDVAELGLDVRAGVHTGECEVMGNDLSGMAVHIGARIGDAAGAGEVLVSSTVKDLVVGSGVRFVERGERELKGVPGSWRLFAVAGDDRHDAAAQTPVADQRELKVLDRFAAKLVRRAPRIARRAARQASPAP